MSDPPSHSPSRRLKSHRVPAYRKVLEVQMQKGGAPPSTELLSAALLEAMRRNDWKLVDSLVSGLQGTLVEDSMTAAWRRALAQGLPLSEEVREDAVVLMVHLRYKLSRQKKNRSKRLSWTALWRLVDRLQADSERLLELLKRNAEEADETVELARRTALGIRAVKRYFYCSYGEVPWEEVEFLVALFVEAQTRYLTLAFIVGNAKIVGTHLEYFLEKLQKLRTWLRDKYPNMPDSDDKMKKMMTLPGGERGEKMTRLVNTDLRLASVVEDFSSCRDSRSLQETAEALSAAIDALGLSDRDWEQWGWLALRRGLFMAGEKMKNSWTSPNLSGRYTRLVELMAPEGALKVLRSGIRDTQAHGDDGTNAAELTMSGLSTAEERQRLGAELGRVLRTVVALQREAEEDLVTKMRGQTEIGFEEESRIMTAVLFGDVNDSIDYLVYEKVIELLEKLSGRSYDWEFEDLKRNLKLKSHSRIPSILNNVETKISINISQNDAINSFALKHCPQHYLLILRLLEWKSSEALSSYKDDLETKVDSPPQPTSSALDRAMSALKLIPDSADSIILRYAVDGGLQALASRWHEDDHAPPLLGHFAPAMFGRQLRDFLNHRDSIIEICSRPTAASPSTVITELSALWSRLRDGGLSGEHGAEPRAQDDGSADEVLRLVQLKDDIFRGARLGDLSGLQRAAEGGVDISSRDCRGRTLLHAAAEAGRLAVVDWLLRLGTGAVDPRAKDWIEQSALHCVASGEVAERLLAACPEVGRDAGGDTPLHSAALSGRADVIQVLLTHAHEDLEAEANNGSTPLHRAALGGHEAAVRVLLQAGAQHRADKEQRTPLQLAALSGSAPTMELLLPRASAEDCWEAAGVAGCRGHVEAFRSLVAELELRGALEDCPAARRAVGAVARGGSEAVARELLQRWPRAVGLELDQGSTALGVAALHGRAGLVRVLLEHGADPLHRDDNRTALHHAAQEGHVEVIRALREHTAQLQALWSGQGERDPPLHLAAAYGHLPAVQLLVELGAGVDTAPEGEDADKTPLLLAARYGRTEVVRWLLEKGAQLYPPGAEQTPLHAAAMFGRLDVVRLLVPSSGLTKKQRGERLGLLQHVGSDGVTAVHASALSGSPLVVQHLLQRELDLLLPHHDRKEKKGESAVWGSLTVYRADARGLTPLNCCVLCGAPPGVFDQLLRHMEDERVMRLGGKDLPAVRDIVQGALECVEESRAVHIAKFGQPPNSERMKRQLDESLERLRERERESLLPRGPLSDDKQ
ncbi:Ankyrin-1 [Frankliniella fusca]|uniref:Ankyrin-1 n=1 Tax=Frankliniella fusca TaxID=407009 RepID=A0AAE1H2L3_9NEOP|nr:Ankyrin-1 [Frankliniella fusca]